MDINVQQQHKLNEEIDAVNIRIDAQMAKRENATTAEDKTFYAQSILRLDDEKKTLLASRDRLFASASSSSQGKDISMAVSPAKLCSRYMRTVVIRLVSFAFDLYWCIRERLRRQWGVYHNITPPIRDSTSR